jgi:diaminopimelate decarboxylase
MVSAFSLNADQAEHLRGTFGTPLYVIEEATILASIAEFRLALSNFKNPTRMSYATKANSTVAVIQIAAREGCHIDVASLGELAAAEMAGVSPANCTFHGNNRSFAELQVALSKGIGEIVLDCLDDIEMVAQIGQGTTQLSMRINPSLETGLHPKVDTGSSLSKFGFTLSDGTARRAFDLASQRGLQVTGVHLHLGSQIFDSQLHAMGLRKLIEFGAECGTEWQLLNIGGGYGVSYVDEVPLDLEALFASLGEVARHAPSATIGIEPGRALVANAGLTLYSVGAIKDVAGVRMVAVDGGMADNPRPALYGAKYRASRPGDVSELAKVKLVGRHCENDVLIEELELPADLASGDLLQIHCTGAYTSSMASNYNRYPRPATVLMRGNEAVLVQRREKIEDLLEREIRI